MKNIIKFKNFVVFIIFSWSIVFIFLPNLMIIITSFLTRDETNFVKLVFTLNNYKRLLDPLYLHTFLHSLATAFYTACICLILGYPFAFFIWILKKKTKILSLFLVIIPFWSNSLIRIYSLKIFLSAKGYLNEFLIWIGIINTPIHIIFTPAAVIIGLVYILFPFIVIPLYSSIEKLDKDLFEAAKDLGANQNQIFIRIIIPLTMPGIISGFFLVFITAMGLFYISDLMGGAKNLLLGNVIKNQFLNIIDWPFGAAISITFILIMGIMLLCYWKTPSIARKQN